MQGGMRGEVRRTVCTRDCPDACGLLVEIDEGRIVRFRGDPEHPVTRGFLCKRTSRYPERMRAASRLTHPLLRGPGGFRPVSMEEALDLCADRIREVLNGDGPEALGFLRGAGSLGMVRGLTDRFFRALGPVVEAAGDICSGAGIAAQERDFGVSDSHDPEDLANARNLVCWGRNPGVSWIHGIPLLRDLRARGGEIHVVDPVTPAPGLPPHRRYAPRPGRDLEAALGVGRILCEKGFPDSANPFSFEGLEEYRALCRSRSVAEWAEAADLRPGDLEELARAFAQGPTALWIGWGLQRRRRGGATVRALDALAAISGNLGRPGGGASFYHRRKRAFDRGLKGEARGRRISWTRLGRDLKALRAPPIRFLYVAGCNPVASLPDSREVAEALEAVPFLVVADTHENDTTRRADLVLPVAGIGECEDLCGAYGHPWIQRAHRLVGPPGEALDDLEILQGLARRLGREELLAGTGSAWARRFLSAEVLAAGLDPEALERGPQRNPLAPGVLFEDGRVATPEGKVRLLERADFEPGETGGGLWLFSNSHRDSQCSQWIGEEPREPPEARLHPEAAGGLADGSPAWLVSPLGRLAVRLRHDPELRTDLVCVPKGGSLDLGRAANAIIPAVETDLGGGAAYLDLRVEVEPR